MKKVTVKMGDAEKTVEVKTPPRKKCSLRDVLPDSVTALVRAAPNNETIRALLLSHLKVSVPAEEDTFDKIKAWVEYNVEKPPKPKTAEELQQEQYAREIEESRRRDEERRRTQIMLQITASEREHGRCNYHQTVEGSGEMPLNREELRRIATNANSDEDFFNRVEEELDSEGPGNYISMTVSGRADYDDFETDETTDSEVTLSEAAKTALKEALRTHYPELYDNLFGE